MSDYAKLLEVIYFLKHYSSAGIPDKKAAETYIEVESDEKIRPLKLQLQAIAEGGFDDELLDKHIGIKRRSRHGSYERWAKLMLLWVHVPKS